MVNILRSLPQIPLRKSLRFVFLSISNLRFSRFQIFSVKDAIIVADFLLPFFAGMGRFKMRPSDADRWSKYHLGCSRIYWRNLTFVVCIFTVVGALFQLFAVSDPSTIWYLFPPGLITPFSTSTLNTTFQNGESLLPEMRLQQSTPAPTYPFGLENSTLSPGSVSDLEEMAETISTKGAADEGRTIEHLNKDAGDLKPMAQLPGNTSFKRKSIHDEGGAKNLSIEEHPKNWVQTVENISFGGGFATEGGPMEDPYSNRSLEVMSQPVENDLSKSNQTNPESDSDITNNNGSTKLISLPVGNVPSDSHNDNTGSGSKNTTNDKDQKVRMAQPVGNVSFETNHRTEDSHGDSNKRHRNPKKLPGNGSPARKTTSRSTKPVWAMLPDEALAYAKKEIDNAPIIHEDPDLYAPVFRNISAFKRSYELMEKILKVYVYKDGPRPIFHTPHLRGIYASEGWFMKLMEENRQFVVKDPNKAHLFYLPYSARQLELSLYVPNSHNMRPLSIFLKDYVNSIAAKYPFWNRTRGSDHFLVACHDWGPYTTTKHYELCKNAIKALCNADASEGIFTPGKDVSLPETTIGNPRKPLRYLGGKPISQRPILAFFAGNMHGRVRPILLEHWEGKDEDMKIYGPLPPRVSRKMSYIQHMKSSKFCICPMGYEVNSPRIVEAIFYECVPVIIADNFVPPLSEVLDWSAFSVIVAEKDIPNLKEILVKIPPRRYITMQTNAEPFSNSAAIALRVISPLNGDGPSFLKDKLFAFGGRGACLPFSVEETVRSMACRMFIEL
ncbi:hypothetical protein ACLOJK_005633 [Asimina triloba]